MDTTRTSPNRLSAAILGAALSATALCFAIGTAQAETPPPSSEAVSYSDLDLSTVDGARSLLDRISIAAKRICGPEPSHSPLQPRAAAFHRECIETSVDTAVARVGSSALLALHSQTESPASRVLAAR